MNVFAENNVFSREDRVELLDAPLIHQDLFFKTFKNNYLLKISFLLKKNSQLILAGEPKNISIS
jgi:hypothetical protein